jgi:hypothetical protein
MREKRTTGTNPALPKSTGECGGSMFEPCEHIIKH